MKVEFTVEEIQRMMDVVVEDILALDLDKKDRASIRRWRSESMGGADPAMKLLAEKLNTELQRTHDRSEVSPIKKPDWA